MVRDEPVTIIDREVLKVLSVDTRMDILKMLSEGSRTPSFLGKKLNRSDATIIEHLNKMVKVGLVKKTVAPGKKWVFYSLTERGNGVVSSKSRRLVIILASSSIALIGGAMSLVSYIYQSYLSRSFAAGPLVSDAEALPLKDVTTTTLPAAFVLQTPDFLLLLSVILIAVAVIGLGYYFYRRSRMG